MSFTVTGQPLTEWTKLTDNTVTAIFTAKKNTSIIGMTFKETNGGTPTLTVAYDDGTTTFYFRNAEAVTVKQRITFDEVFVIRGGGSIKVTSNDASGHFDCSVTYLNPDATALGR